MIEILMDSLDYLWTSLAKKSGFDKLAFNLST